MIYKGYLWIVAFALALILLFIFTCVRDAQAKTPFAYTTVHALQIAENAWGPCDGPITISRAPLDNHALGRVIMVDANICADGNPFNNTILITTKWRFSWQRYCTVLVHEDGHLHGRDHSLNPRSIMAPQSDGIWKFCIPKSKRWQYAGALTASLAP